MTSFTTAGPSKQSPGNTMELLLEVFAVSKTKDAI